ncbi:mismatch-specific DNA-glycosylase [Arthrobacter sp. StoSoilA2]|uniref:mismatch-specific DNA-glycosylase n=1 Tax=unclassified Arthrobacter TaxID=235627 RepID=UPI001CC394E1|nr:MULTISPECIES: mismatch-specific DNA-glycosylase [unclassified Arthrobacter]BCW37475.1 mismatch-specific DNA-glycosylase [Arthrobacter sp. StoSoilA2]BCW49714.1 mismatch-specific DNA-glycosylase [Arthrobacter sp. StoSoilB13]
MGLGRVALDAFRGLTLPDLVSDQTRLLFVGINPGLRAAAVQAHFGGGSNRFYPALFRAGIVDRRIDASAGFRPGDLNHLLERGVGITSIVAEASARADELTPEQLLAGAKALSARVELMAPAMVAVLGIGAYRTAFARPRATWGRQPDSLGRSPVWVLPNPSGLNRHASLADLAAAYREVAVAAGIEPFPGPE